MSIIAVCKSAEHNMKKDVHSEINLLQGLGVEGDAHAGIYVQHLTRVKINPTTPNIRQVCLLHSELHDELKEKGFLKSAQPGEMGENITTRGLAIQDLPVNTKLHLGSGGAIIQLTGLRNPCRQLNDVEPELMKACFEYDGEGKITHRKGGVMSIVLQGGIVKTGDNIVVELPEEPHQPMVLV
ncbi:hypothetical protein SAMD00019534_002350 [Acytostelium subglobosum LB1]|uniref:hypothetical protein n=1 Tax=Acytostelium subglobosum LB1 TaxID=1410327 RepID=UPI000644E424|nr:hypothetical protein SAMD00019534_002350 [Acytostelium subglobosum LB1]GAM17060.1 hypothetical protein SAMD00019534_002350 [Acytostelium subglobosum LB1]|eukprot:XP_012759122.1 hypothetical protein SAMD00019534_002350 [Acytostelium subglobosum LB1]